MPSEFPRTGHGTAPFSLVIFVFATEVVFVGILYGPLFLPLNHFGIIDYDQFLAWQLVVNDALKSGQALHWFHHLCGGVPALADPQSQALSPFNLLGLAVNPVVQSKISVVLHLIAAAAGFHMLARRACIPALFSAAAFVIWSGNGFVVFRLLHGQETFYPLFYLPLLLALLWPHLESGARTDSLRADLLAGTALVSLIILEDGFQVLIYAWLFFGLAGTLNVLLHGDFRALKVITVWMVWAVAVCSVRVLPMVELLSEYPRFTSERDFLTPAMLRDAFLSAGQLELYLGFRPDPPHNVWAAYGAYTGVTPLLLAGYGAVRLRAQKSAALCALAFAMLGCLLLMLGHFADWSPWALLHGLPLMDMVRAPHRFASMVIFAIAIVALFAQQDIHRRLGGGTAKALIIAIVTASACAAGQVRALRPVLKMGFAAHQPAHDRIEYRNEFRHRIVDPARMYSAVAANQGAYNCYRALELPNAARTDMPLATADDPDAAVAAAIGPNSITVRVRNSAPAAVLINENHHRDWTVTAGRPARLERDPGGLMKLRVPPGDGSVRLRFVPDMFLAGAALSVLFLALTWLVAYRWKRSRAAGAAPDH